MSFAVFSFPSQKPASGSIVLFCDSLEQGKKYCPAFGLPFGMGPLVWDPPCRAVALHHLLGSTVSSVCLLPHFPAPKGLVLKLSQDLFRKWLKVRHRPSLPAFLCSSYLGDHAWIWKPSWWFELKACASGTHPILFSLKTIQAVWPL